MIIFYTLCFPGRWKMKVDNLFFNIFGKTKKITKQKQMKLQTCLFQFQYSNFSEMILKMMLRFMDKSESLYVWMYSVCTVCFNIHNTFGDLRDDFQSVLRSLRTLMVINIINGSLNGMWINVIR